MAKPITRQSSWRKRMSTFQSPDIDTKRARYKLQKVIGTGQYATVWRAWDRQQQRTCTVKDIDIKLYKCDVEKALTYVLAEIDVMKRIDHPNVLRIYDDYMGYVGREPHVYLVTEFCDGGTLKQWLRENNKQASSVHRHIIRVDIDGNNDSGAPLPPNTHPMVRPSWEQTCRHVVRQIIAGYAALHHQRIMHRDLKPENILMIYTRDGNHTDSEQAQRHGNLRTPIIKLADFGFSKVLNQDGGGEVDLDGGANLD